MYCYFICDINLVYITTYSAMDFDQICKVGGQYALEMRMFMDY